MKAFGVLFLLGGKLETILETYIERGVINAQAKLEDSQRLSGFDDSLPKNDDNLSNNPNNNPNNNSNSGVDPIEGIIRDHESENARYRDVNAERVAAELSEARIRAEGAEYSPSASVGGIPNFARDLAPRNSAEEVQNFMSNRFFNRFRELRSREANFEVVSERSIVRAFDPGFFSS